MAYTYQDKNPASYKFYANTDDNGNFVDSDTATSNTLFTFNNFKTTIAKSPSTYGSQIENFDSLLNDIFGISAATVYRRWTVEIERVES